MARCRNCNGCKALYISKCHATCELGFKIRQTNKQRVVFGSVIDTMLLSADPECPKPRTNKAMMDFGLERSRLLSFGHSKEEANSIAKKLVER